MGSSGSLRTGSHQTGASGIIASFSLATPHNSRLTPCAPPHRPLRTACFEKMLVNTQSIPCAFLFAIGTHCPVIQHAELCGAALN
jgi:hypothetical protein